MELATSKPIDTRKYSHPAIISLAFNAILFFSLYFYIITNPTPQWGRELIEYLKPIIKELDYVAYVERYRGKDPFLAQIMMIYSTAAWLTMMAYYFIDTYFNKKIYRYFIYNLQKQFMIRIEENPKKYGRKKLLFYALSSALIAFFCQTTVFSPHYQGSIMIQNIRVYSSHPISLLYFRMATPWIMASWLYFVTIIAYALLNMRDTPAQKKTND